MPPGLSLPNFSGAALAANLLFSSIGFVALVYGKRMHAWKPMLIGLALMAYTYFVESAVVLCAVGVLLIAMLFLFRE